MATVHVSNINYHTTEKEVRDFFSFCGKITSLSFTPSTRQHEAPQTAAVTFEKESAAKTALLLDQTQLGPACVKVTAASSLDEIVGGKATTAAEAKDENNNSLEQEDKPRSRIFAEYLAHGYTISDQAIEKAISFDKQHGFSNRFQAALANFDSKYHATEKAKGIDESYKISEKVQGGWQGLASYFEQALNTPTGRKIREFYMNSEKQVQDIHTEARRLADLKKSEGTEQPTGGVPVSSTTGTTATETGSKA